MNNIVKLEPTRLPMNAAIAEEYELTPAGWRVLVNQTFPNARTPDAILMALEYCRSRNLDILKRPVHIVPMWSSEKGAMVETVWPGISEIRTTAARTGEYAGIDEIEFGPDIRKKFIGNVKEKGKWINDKEIDITFPEWVRVTVYRMIKGQKCAFTTPKTYWMEMYAIQGSGDLPNATWQRRVHGQAAKCVEAAALRMAFPEEVGNDYSAEEMSGQVLLEEHNIPTTDTPVEGRGDNEALPPAPPAPPTRPEPEDSDEETPEEVLERASTWFNNSNDIEALETAWQEFQHFLDEWDNADDINALQDLYSEAALRIEPNILGAG